MASPPNGRHWLAAFGIILIGSLLSAEAAQSWLSARQLATQFVSTPLWLYWAGPPIMADAAGQPTHAAPEFVGIWGISLSLLGAIVLLVTTAASWSTRQSWARLFCGIALIWGSAGIAVGLWDWCWIAAHAFGITPLADLLELTPQFWLSGCLAGGLAVSCWWSSASAERKRSASVESQVLLRPLFPWKGVLIAISLYTIMFTAMNWQLYFNLLVPHGDSVMYEEHLWNVLHGKGFRSYLDQGLFLGEHLQVIHLGLLPLYILWPSHLLLEFCESLAIGAGAIPAAWMTFRQTQSRAMALSIAVAYLCYFPTQFLDIEIDLKTFRPEAFGLPILLAALERLDARKLGSGLVWGLATLLVKEDYAIVLFMLGLWIVATGYQEKQSRWFIAGACLSVFAVSYLFFATRIAMPYFRSGAEIHYASYFQTFGKTPEEIIYTFLTRPDLVFQSFVTLQTTLYALALFVPLAGLPLFSPGRLLVGLPTFGILCLNELARDPRHQFHGPLVAIIFWALAPALARAPQLLERGGTGLFQKLRTSDYRSLCSHLVWTSSLATSIFFSLSPWGLAFWDFGSEWYAGKLYGDTRRAEQFAKVWPLIPQNARVASTDFIHPRFTHFERSYDYSGYVRKVSGDKTGAPADTDYIVIDTQHPYSTIKTVEEIPEYRDHPEDWEVVPNSSEGYFLVLKRKKMSASLTPETSASTAPRAIFPQSN